MTTRSRIALLATAVALGAAGTADAATVATGVDRSDVAIAPDGTALIATKTGGVNGNTLGFCRIPFRGSACESSVPPVPQVVAADGSPDNPSSVTGLQLLRRPADGLLVLLTTTFDVDVEGNAGDTQAFVTTSADSGTTWTPQAQVGTGQGPVVEAALTPDGAAIDMIDDGPTAARYSRLPLAGGLPAAPALVLPAAATDVSAAETLTTLPDGTVLAGFAVGDRFGIRRLAPGADPIAGWTPWQRVRTARSTGFRLLSGPRGAFLFSARALLAQVRANYRKPLERRRITATGTGGRTLIADGSTNLDAGFAIDPAGGQHVAFWNRTGRKAVVYLRTRGARGRCSYGAQTRLARVRYTRELRDGVQIAAASPKRAVVVFNTAAGLRAEFARGGDRPKPRPRQGC